MSERLRLLTPGALILRNRTLFSNLGRKRDDNHVWRLHSLLQDLRLFSYQLNELCDFLFVEREGKHSLDISLRKSRGHILADGKLAFKSLVQSWKERIRQGI